ncbi:MAG: ABC transporter permease [Burkholderiales bacterium]|nr:ABC transporter permease [Phycisphaerae bacterium]
MSEIANPLLANTFADSPPRTRSLFATALHESLRKTAARVGLAWLGVVTFCAVFAPLLANSRPILLKSNGRWSSPLIAGLQWTDVLVFVSCVLIVVAGRMKKPALTWRLLAIGLIMLLTGLITFQTLGYRTKQIMVYSQYREAEAAGQVQWILRTPIPYSPSDYVRDQFDPTRPSPQPPQRRHWLGTERNGGDIASRMIHACRIALAVGFIAEGVALVIGVSLGGLMGYLGRAVDLIGMRLVEIFSSIPQLYLLLTFVAFFDRNLYLIMLIIGLTSWTGYALFTRAEFLRLRNLEFVHAAVAAGLPRWRVIFLHMLPNGLAPILVTASFGVASAILMESSLSFLGLGLVDEPSWGQMLNQALGAGGFAWWLGVFPGLAIFLTVLAYNFIGDTLRDALDPRLLKRQ